ncbi:MAG: hypothetical protein O2877_02695, partial [bacterium]|nr:hypothetical protein [bacterium]
DKPVEDISTIGKEGDVIDFKIVSIEPKEHRLGLSLKTNIGTEDKSGEAKTEEGEKTEEKTEIAADEVPKSEEVAEAPSEKKAPVEKKSEETEATPAEDPEETTETKE